MGRSAQSKLISWDWIAGGLLVSFFLSPLLIILSKSPQSGFSWDVDFAWVLKNTFMQAIFSGVLATVLGFLGALGLVAYGRYEWKRKILEVILLGPTFFPTLFSLVLCMTWIDPFPFGIIGIGIVHAFISFGLVSVFLARELERELGGLTQWALIEGASRSQIFRALLIPLSQKLRKAFFLVFAMTFSSFTVPLVVGGGRGTTLEVFIYEKIRIESNFSAAIFLSVFQTLMVLSVSWLFFGREISTSTVQSNLERRFRILNSKWIFWVMVLMSFGLTLGLAHETYSGWLQAQALGGLTEQILELIVPSLNIVFMVLLLQALLFICQISLHWSSLVQKSIAGLTHFSPAIIGFSTLLFWGSTSVGLAVSLALLFYPALWRLFGHERFLALHGQMEMASLMGASRWQSLKIVVLPQMLGSFAMMTGVMSLWTLGDFAISKLVMGQEATLGILAGNLMSSYRIQASFFVTMLIMLGGVLSFVILQAGAYVLRTKSS